MARPIHLLTPAKVRSNQPGFFADGGGLYLLVTPGANGRVSKSWVFRYFDNRRERQMGLGSERDVSLAEARLKALEARKLRLEGIDPIEHKRAQRAARALDDARKVRTFQQCAKEYLDQFDGGWKSRKHHRQWHQTLQDYILPVLGPLDVNAINTELVLQILRPIWTTKPESASRIRGRIETVLDFAGRNGENPARWKGHLEHRLPRRNKLRDIEPMAAMPWNEMPALMATLRTRTDVATLALRFCILTACRSGEVLGAVWSEIDLEQRLWTIPGTRMKRDKPHKVPLSDEAIGILEYLHSIRSGDLVFPCGQNAMLRALRELNGDVTVHGFRSSFRDWAAECTDVPDRVIEMALAHAVGDATMRAYLRSDQFERRRALMALWASYLAGANNVVRFAGGKQEPSENTQEIEPQAAETVSVA
jgi:integrase